MILDKLGINEVTTGATSRVFRLIHLNIQHIDVNNVTRSNEAYHLSVDTKKAIITIFGNLILLDIIIKSYIPSVYHLLINNNFLRIFWATNSFLEMYVNIIWRLLHAMKLLLLLLYILNIFIYLHIDQHHTSILLLNGWFIISYIH